jgi:hypothetical protein
MLWDDFTNVGTTPFFNSTSPKTRTCKLPTMQREPNKKARKRGRLFPCSFAIIANAIIKFTHIGKELEMKKMEMTKFIKSQLLQIEKNGKHIIVQGQLQMNAFFGTVLKTRTTNGSGGSDN